MLSSKKRLVWVGATEHPEIEMHWHHVRLHRDVHLRTDLKELAQFPALEANEIVVVRLDRRPLAENIQRAAVQSHPGSQWNILEGSSVQGAARASKLWPNMNRIPWHAPVSIWDDCDPTVELKTRHSVAILGGQRSDVIWIAERFETLGHPVVALSVDGYRGLYQIPLWIWDDSAIDRLGENQWLEQIVQIRAQATDVRHFALASLLNWQTRQRWLNHGIDQVFAKPIVNDLLFYSVGSGACCR